MLAPWAAVEAAAGGSPDPGHPDEGHTPSEGEPDEGQDEDDEKEEEEDLVCPAPEPPVDLVIIRDETKPKAIETRVVSVIAHLPVRICTNFGKDDQVRLRGYY